MNELVAIDKDNWREFVEADASVVVLGKTTCAACSAWTEEVRGFLETDGEVWDEVRFGKMNLDQRGLFEFKRANPWLSDLTDLPYTLIVRNGEIAKKFPGGGQYRLKNRLEKVFAT